ncbi:hypothetical protein CSB11_00305 [Candidatus Campbellbacteria bacterium]|nr:MAG: hypothetical protein CSB11_00305 [Candidatus Campbellbacteria bacterium]
MTILEAIAKKKNFDRVQIENIEQEKEEKKLSYDEVLVERGLTEEEIFDIKKEYFSSFNYKEFDKFYTISDEVMSYIPLDTVKRYHLVPLGISSDDFLEVGMLNPENMAARNILQFISTKIGKPYRVFLLSLDQYKIISDKYSGVKSEVTRALGQYSDAQEKELNELRKRMGNDVTDDIIKEDGPIAKIVSNIIKGAAEKKASDIHIEVTEKELVVRYRIDGILEKEMVLPRNVHRSVVARIKILSKIKIDEKRKPQDGRFSGVFFNRKIDFRVSTFPTFYGEKVVMRLLEQDRGALPIESIGFSKANLDKIKDIIAHSYGIILICGPTGSGKTNTLYSLLNEIDKETKNVVSLENPIELNVPGVSQSQVRPEIGYTFAGGLRSILRQDPDVIMVGEIRDEETASLAIEASLTGHLVLSTIHTNTAADVPQRLVDMGVEPYLIGPTLIATIGQRLIRKIIPENRVEEKMDEDVKVFIEKTTKNLDPKIRKKILESDKVYKAVPSELDDDGMKGRTAVFEILEMSDELKRLIIKDPSSLSIYSQARKEGFVTFKEDGIIKALNGVTTFEEVMGL